MIHQMTRSFFLFLSSHTTLNHFAQKWGLKFGASHIVAGETVNDALRVAKQLHTEGLTTVLDHLGEFVHSKEEAREATNAAIATIERIATSPLDIQLSVKLTQLGLSIDEDFCLQNMTDIVAAAKTHEVFVCIDMENYAHYEQTIRILNKLRQQNKQVGTVLQAYLRRAMNDLKQLHDVPLRLVKGAYKESEEVAFQKKAIIDEHFYRLITTHLKNGAFTAIATHDHRIIEKVISFVQQNNIPNDSFEFQFLYGFRPNLQQQLVQQGYAVRVYVPFGKDWFGYFMRRLAERPQNISFAMRGLLQRK